MRLALRFFAPLLVLGVAHCGDSVGEPITNQDDADSGIDAHPRSDASPGADASRDAAADADSKDAPSAIDGAITVDASLDAAADSDACHCTANNLPRLVVASSDHISLWNNASDIAADRLNDVSLNAGGLSGGVSSVSVYGHRVLVGRKPTGGAAAIVAFDNAATMDATATPAATVDRVGSAITFLRTDSAGHVWAGDFNGISMFFDADTFTSAATQAALFTHSFQQVPTCAFDPTSGRLFVGQVSGAGVLAWNDASVKSGSPTNDFKLADGAYWGMTIAGNRLYAVGTHANNTSNGVAIWNAVQNLAATTPPNVTLTNGYPFQTYIPDVAVRDDVLAVAARDANKVMIYATASAISTDQAPDAVLTSPLMLAPSRVVFGPSGRLYILDRTGVLIYSNLKGAPTFVAKVTTGLSAPVDIAIVE